jgi:hypothetical protein
MSGKCWTKGRLTNAHPILPILTISLNSLYSFRTYETVLEWEPTLSGLHKGTLQVF